MPTPKDLRVVVVGSGRTGHRTARLLSERGHDVVIVERNPGRVHDLAEEWVATVIEGDATDPEVLRQADLEDADVVVATTDTTGTNFTVCALASEIAPGVRTVMRAGHETTDDYEAFVDDVVVPERAGARATVNAVESGIQFLEETATRVELLEIRVAPDAPLAGEQLGDVGLPEGAMIVSDVERTHVVTGETVLAPERTYVVAVEPGVAEEMRQLFRG